MSRPTDEMLREWREMCEEARDSWRNTATQGILGVKARNIIPALLDEVERHRRGDAYFRGEIGKQWEALTTEAFEIAEQRDRARDQRNALARAIIAYCEPIIAETGKCPTGLSEAYVQAKEWCD